MNRAILSAEKLLLVCGCVCVCVCVCVRVRVCLRELQLTRGRKLQLANRKKLKIVLCSCVFNSREAGFHIVDGY